MSAEPKTGLREPRFRAWDGEGWETPRCERPTKSGSPCRATLSNVMFGQACYAHKTDEDKVVERIFMRIYDEGKASGERFSGVGLLKEKVFRLEARIQEFEGESAPIQNIRTEDRHGRQIVVVDDRLTYVWDGREPLSVGDVALAPPTYWQSGAQKVTVTGIGSTYTGEMRCLREVPRAEPAAN